eukprot:TRINITY_DN3307_c0_g2_i3.p1 TRINITY_DN3307_c0_g2~~TRINITY_DN3307_c0_g2_i3.p1  ORF type:complete len:293 (-),score=43.40 TRINITY_DN3307_c0_g2_i3:275-1099(-)
MGGSAASGTMQSPAGYPRGQVDTRLSQMPVMGGSAATGTMQSPAGYPRGQVDTRLSQMEQSGSSGSGAPSPAASLPVATSSCVASSPVASMYSQPPPEGNWDSPTPDLFQMGSVPVMGGSAATGAPAVSLEPGCCFEFLAALGMRPRKADLDTMAAAAEAHKQQVVRMNQRINDAEASKFRMEQRINDAEEKCQEKLAEFENRLEELEREAKRRRLCWPLPQFAKTPEGEDAFWELCGLVEKRLAMRKDGHGSSASSFRAEAQEATAEAAEPLG